MRHAQRTPAGPAISAPFWLFIAGKLVMLHSPTLDLDTTSPATCTVAVAAVAAVAARAAEAEAGTG